MKTLLALLPVLLLALPVTAQQTSKSDYLLLTFDPSLFPKENFTVDKEWLWKDENQPNYTFTWCSVKRKSDGLVAGTWVHVWSKVKNQGKVLLLPAQDLAGGDNSLAEGMRFASYAENYPQMMDNFMNEVNQMDKLQRQAFMLSLANYLSKYTTLVHNFSPTNN